MENVEKESEEKVVKKQTRKKEEKIGDALMKVALGYQIAEVTEEYAEVNGELKLTKRKKTKKDVPPDLKAVQLLLSSTEPADYGGWTDEALQAEKERLLSEITKQAAVTAQKTDKKKNAKKNEEQTECGGQVCVEVSVEGQKEGKGTEKPSGAKRSVTKKTAVRKTVAKRKVKSEK